jgi:hypothetical protein
VPFELTLDGHTYNTDDLTVAEAVALEKELGRSWQQLNPLGSAEEFQAFAAVCLRRHHSAEEAAKLAAELPLGVALAAAKWVADDLPIMFEDGLPKAEGDPSTTTSSSTLGRRTAGPPTSPGGSQSGI